MTNVRFNKNPLSLLPESLTHLTLDTVKISRHLFYFDAHLFPNLVYLNLSRNLELLFLHLHRISQFKLLKTLILDWCPDLDELGYVLLTRGPLSSLTHFSAQGSPMTRRALSAICRKFKGLESLRLDTKNLEPACFHEVARLAQLERIVLFFEESIMDSSSYYLRVLNESKSLKYVLFP